MAKGSTLDYLQKWNDSDLLREGVKLNNRN